MDLNLLLVANSSKALIYEIKGFKIQKLIETFDAPETITLHNVQARRDNYYQKAGSQSHALDPHSEAKELNREDFSKAIAEKLLSHYTQTPFKNLSIIAEPKVLGDLRKSLDKRISALIKAEITKDLIHLPSNEIEKFLG